MRSQANGLRPHFSLRQIENILLRKPPSREFALSALTQRQVKKARHIERKRNIPPKKYGIYTLHFSRGILHYVQNDVFFHPPGRLPQSLRSFAKTNKKVRHIERKRNIPPKKYGVYTLHFSRGILHFVQNDVFFYPSREIAAVATLLRKDSKRKRNTFTCSLSIRAGRTGGRDRRG